MTQEEKELLLKDLCARLPYGIFVKENRESLDDSPTIYTFDYHPCIDNCKPYLRPMSSMTEEEKEEWHNTFDSVQDYVPEADDYDDNWHEEHGIESYDYLISHYFDYRGLIPKGLALEAHEDIRKMIEVWQSL